MKLAQTLIATTLAMCSISASSGQTLQPIDQLAVVDANGKTVGKFVELWQGDATLAAVALKVNDLIFELWVVPNRLQQSPAPPNFWTPLSFESSDCTGQAFQVFGQPTLGGAVNVVLSVPGTTVYVPVGPPQQISGLSYMDYTGTCNQGQYSGTAVPLQAAINLDTFFTPPFRLTTTSGSTPAAACCGDCNGNGQVTVDEILTSVNSALNGCPTP